MRNKVLLVEDSKAVQQMYRNKLSLEQFQVMTADNGMEAIKLLSKEKPDIILLDLMMPIMDGYKVLQVIKTDAKLAKIPVLVFSAKGQPEEVEKSLNLGASGYIVKATTKPNEVVEKIKTVLEQQPIESELKHYSIEIREDAYDVKKLADNFNLNNLRCTSCQAPMLLDLIPDFSHDTPWFSGKFFCPRCNKD
jgi:two-component system phosphate regulon response regulator PhoB/two-component system alkaline phosphatase synthesis response regulator PhoP